MREEIDYTDQGGRSIAVFDRRITSFFTPYGIKEIHSNYGHRIRNINNEVIKVYNINRVLKTFIGTDGKIYEHYQQYETVYQDSEYELNGKHCGYGIRVIWYCRYRELEIQHDFTYCEFLPIFNEITKRECKKTLRESIITNPHLHQDIKNNLILNLNNYIDEL